MYEIDTFETTVLRTIRDQPQTRHIITFSNDLFNQKLQVPNPTLKFIDSSVNINITMIHDIHDLESWILRNLSVSGPSVLYGMIDRLIQWELSVMQLNHLLYLLSKLTIRLVEPKQHQCVDVDNIDDTKVSIDLILRKWLT